MDVFGLLKENLNSLFSYLFYSGFHFNVTYTQLAATPLYGYRFSPHNAFVFDKNF